MIGKYENLKFSSEFKNIDTNLPLFVFVINI